MSYKNNPYGRVPEEPVPHPLHNEIDPPSTEVARYADVAMFKAEPLSGATGPAVHVLSMNPDPLGSVAAATLMYTGRVIRDLAEVTDEERRQAWNQIQKTKLKAPFEFVKIHMLFENVHRGLTHQLVRQRTAVYAQESMRFAVKEGLAGATHLPPSLQEFYDPARREAMERKIKDRDGLYGPDLDDKERQYLAWETATREIQGAYDDLINLGMPAEEARGLTPTNIGTRVHYATDLRALADHAGNRLCTQAQFEWRQLWLRIIPAIQQFGWKQTYWRPDPLKALGDRELVSSAWQFDLIAGMFRPVCYLTGKCEFAAMDLDRACKIRDRVDANHSIGRKSDAWHEPYKAEPFRAAADGQAVFIGAINPAEWLADPAAARVKG